MVRGISDTLRDEALAVALKAESDPKSLTPEEIRRLAGFVREVVRADLMPDRPELTEEQKAGLDAINKFSAAGKRDQRS